MNAAKFFVSRQKPYYSDGRHQVEVAQGGVDYSGADMLVIRYRKLGEGEEFIGLRPAIDAAIAIARKWLADDGEPVYIAVGCTHGIFTELEGEEFQEELAKRLQAEADEFDSKLPHCSRCGELIESENPYVLTDFEDEKFCSENCAEMFFAEELALNSSVEDE